MALLKNLFSPRNLTLKHRGLVILQIYFCKKIQYFTQHISNLKLWQKNASKLLTLLSLSAHLLSPGPQAVQVSSEVEIMDHTENIMWGNIPGTILREAHGSHIT